MPEKRTNTEPTVEFRTEVTLVGRVAADPTIVNTTKGKKVAKFPVAVPESNEKDASAEFFNVTCFNKIAENTEKYVKKGKTVKVIGRLAVDRWEKDGVKHTKVYIVANKVEYLSK